MPRLLAAQGPDLAGDGSKMLNPLERYGLKAMSMGFLVEENTPLIWRGPMVMGALVQMLRGRLGPSRRLVVDMPPGTGDVSSPLPARRRCRRGHRVDSAGPGAHHREKVWPCFEKVKCAGSWYRRKHELFRCTECGAAPRDIRLRSARAEAETLAFPSWARSA